MPTVSRKQFILKGLNCAYCSSKIEGEIKNLNGVKLAQIDFASQKLIVETDDSTAFNKLEEEIISVVKRIEPEISLVSEEKNAKVQIKEIGKDFESKKKAIIRLMLSAALFVLGLTLNLPFIAELALFFISYCIVGGQIVLRAVKNISRGQVFDENLLMTIATVGAFLIGELPEGVAVMLFYQVGEFFQEIAVDRSRKSINSLMDIRADFAHLKVGADLRRVSPQAVEIGDLIVIKPGEKVPLDGKVIEGNSLVDTSALTGESLPRDVEPGNDILSGSININGVLTVQVTRSFAQSTAAKILELVQSAGSRKAQTENFITKFARYYTPLVVISALLIALVPPLVQGAGFSDWIYRSLVFLVISCPCALVISIPLGFFGGIGGASRKGVLVKGSKYLEALNSVETVVFDKTGTLTQGVFNVTEVKAQKDYSREQLLEYAAYAESYSNHPIAAAILHHYGQEIDERKIVCYEEITGYGIRANMTGQKILAGNAKLMKQANINYDKVDSVGTIVHVSVNNAYVGYILISDEVKKDAAHAIQLLKGMGIKKVVMLTGDTKSVGEKIGKELGLDEVYAELLPADKVEKLELMESHKSAQAKIIFVGDGMNDAPVLARSDIGIAMGGLGSDAAIEAADIVIMTDEPSKVATVIKIAKRTRTIVWQNILFALGVKLVFIALGALGIASMWEAVFADVGVAIIAISNAMRVMMVKNI
ncbi:MAG: heavy metal translocating P-type ATPase [Bacillota bacterium]